MTSMKLVTLSPAKGIAFFIRPARGIVSILHKYQNYNLVTILLYNNLIIFFIKLTVCNYINIIFMVIIYKKCLLQ